MARRNVLHKVMHGLYSKPRYRTVLPDPVRQPASSPWYFTAGPVFTPGGDGAILQSKLSKPWQSIPGYAYLVQNPQKYTPLQPPQLYAPKGVPFVGINIQLGSQQITTPSVNSDGTFADQGIFGQNMSADYGEAIDTSEYAGDYA